MKSLKSYIILFAGFIFISLFSSGVLAKSSHKNSTKNEEYVITSPPQRQGLDVFYRKYSNVTGFHILSSHRVPDSAFVKACEIIDFMTSGLPDPVLAQMVKVDTRVGIMARYEGTTDIPEYAHLALECSGKICAPGEFF